MSFAALILIIGAALLAYSNGSNDNFKGVATLLGTLIGLQPMLGLIALGSWLFTYFVFRYSSLSAIMSAVITPPVAFIIGFGNAIVVLLIMAGLLLWRHRENIERLRTGTEPMVDWNKKS